MYRRHADTECRQHEQHCVGSRIFAAFLLALQPAAASFCIPAAASCSPPHTALTPPSHRPHIWAPPPPAPPPQVIGSAIALLLLSRGAVPLWAGVLLSVSGSFMLLLVDRCGVSTLEALFGLLISIMVGSFAVRREWWRARRQRWWARM